jgi:hypothetical protein
MDNSKFRSNLLQLEQKRILRTKKEIGIENGIGIEKRNKKSSQLRTKNVALSSLRREMKIFGLIGEKKML